MLKQSVVFVLSVVMSVLLSSVSISFSRLRESPHSNHNNHNSMSNHNFDSTNYNHNFNTKQHSHISFPSQSFSSHSNPNVVVKGIDSVCSNNVDLFLVSAPYVCFTNYVAAVTSLSEDLVLSPELLNEWKNILSLVLLRPRTLSTLYPEISQLTNLQYLALEQAVTGEIPSTLTQLTALTYLRIKTSVVTGSIPERMEQLSLLEYIEISSCRIEGTLPDALFSISSLESLDASVNFLTGTIPTTIGTSQLRVVQIQSNQLFGTIPTEIGTMSMLTTLNLSFNSLVGTIPSQIGQLTGLTTLELDGNQLTGTIPSQLGRLTALLNIRLDHNGLSGTMPLQLAHLTSLILLSLSVNRLDGTVPPDVLAKWSAHSVFSFSCDYSGLMHPSCARDCLSCGITEFEVRSCDSRGQHQQCVAGYYFLPLLVLYVILIAFGLKRISPQNTSPSRFALEAMMSALGTADFATHVAFAFTTRSHALFISSLSLLFVSLIVNFVVSVMTISRVATDIGYDGSFQYPQFRARVYESTFLLSCTTTFCAVNIRVLGFVVGEDNLAASQRLVGLRTIAGVLAVVVCDIPQLVVLVLALVLANDKQATVVLALVVTVLSVLVEALIAIRSRAVARSLSVTMFTPVATKSKSRSELSHKTIHVELREIHAVAGSNVNVSADNNNDDDHVIGDGENAGAALTSNVTVNTVAT